MRVLVNATTLVVGGSVQVGASFIDYASGLDSSHGMEFLFLVSERIHANLSRELQADPRVHRIAPSPARLIRGKPSRRAVKAFEREFAPDLVYSIGSPSYLRFSVPELARFTWPWGTHPSKLAWSILAPRDRFLRKLELIYKMQWLRHVAFFETQTETAARGISLTRSVDRDRIRVIPNALSQMFERAVAPARPEATAESGVVTVLTLAAAYPHKNFAIIPPVAAMLRRTAPQLRFRFIVTLPDTGAIADEFWRLAERHDVSECIENVGLVDLRDCPALYQRADLFFLPTLLETFSVSYLEAMHMRVPIVTTDLGFARDICGEAASYFDPTSVEEAASSLLRVASDPELRSTLIERGSARLAEFPRAAEKYQLVVEWIRECAQRGADRS